MVTSSWIQGKSCSGEKNKVMHKDVKQSQDILIKLISINYRPISFIIEYQFIQQYSLQAY